MSVYGVRGRARNARIAGSVRLSRGGDGMEYRLRELPAREAAPVLRQYPITRPNFDVRLDASDAAIELEAPRHPGLTRLNYRRPV